MFGDMGKMMKLAMEMKTKLPALKEKLASSMYDAKVGGGVVTAVVNGKMGLVDLKIDSSLLTPGQTDASMIEDLVKAAVSAAQQKAAVAAEQAMAELTGGMKLPGMDGLF